MHHADITLSAEVLGQQAAVVQELVDDDLIALFDNADSMVAFFEEECTTGYVTGDMKEAFEPLVLLTVAPERVADADGLLMCRPLDGSLDNTYGHVPPQQMRCPLLVHPQSRKSWVR
jgi:hypothetical protein